MSCKCLSLVVVLWCCWATHRCALMHSGIKAKRQPFCGWCFLEIMCLGRGQRQVFSVTFCQMLELRIRTLLLDWKRGSEALSRHHSYHPGFEAHFSLRATAFSINPNFLLLSLVLKSISDCTPISTFVSIHSTSCLRGRGFDTRHTPEAIDTSFISAHIPPRMFGFNAVSA